MPIRFYCPFCDQLLGISRRRVGAVVECPNCHGGVGVPPEGSATGVLPPPVPTTAVVLTPAQMTLLAVVVVLLASIAFAAGLLVGKLT